MTGSTSPETAPRPLLHFTAASGWMNDPNGLIEHNGVHHLFFQHNPVATTFGTMHWGHATSSDLLHWTQHETALTPGDAGDFDGEGCWSGCAATLSDGTVVLLYSANADGKQLAALAYAGDDQLRTWKKAPENPVIATWPLEDLTDVRDHSLMRTSTGWRQVIATGVAKATQIATGTGGRLVSYLCRGDDMTEWTYEGVFLDGEAEGLPGEVFECPDVFTAPGCAPNEVVVITSWLVRGEPGRASPSSDVLWLTGPIEDGRFAPRRYGRLDLGGRFYAPQSYTSSDSRRLAFGWLRTQDDPAAGGRPYVGAQSLPRSLRVVAGRLVQELTSELQQVRATAVGELGEDTPHLDLPAPAVALEVLVTVSQAEALPEVVVVLEGTGGHRAEVSFAAFGTDSTWVRTDGRWLAEHASACTARLIVDAGLFEVFTDDGRTAATSDLSVSSVSGVTLRGAGASAVVTARLPA